jgi:tRNA(fMet)-specific endonuclease VapC
VSFLLDTNIVSEHLRGKSSVTHRMFQHAGRLSIATISLGELYAWVWLKPQQIWITGAIADFLKECEILDFDRRCAEVFGELRGILKPRGITIPPPDLMIASVALAHDLTLITHNTADFQRIPHLRLDDWLAS